MTKAAEAIWNYRPWMEKFNRHEYKKMLGEYALAYEEAFAEIVRQDKPAADIAESLLEELVQKWKAQPFWKRGRLQEEIKMMLITFTSPMLLLSEDPLCGELAGALCEEWKRRWPKDAYIIADRDQIQSGFRSTVLGIDLEELFFGKSKK